MCTPPKAGGGMQLVLTVTSWRVVFFLLQNTFTPRTDQIWIIVCLDHHLHGIENLDNFLFKL